MYKNSCIFAKKWNIWTIKDDLGLNFAIENCCSMTSNKYYILDGTPKTKCRHLINPVMCNHDSLDECVLGIALIWKPLGGNVTGEKAYNIRVLGLRHISPPFIIWQKRTVFCVLSGKYRMLWLTSNLTKHLGLQYTHLHTRVPPALVLSSLGVCPLE